MARHGLNRSSGRVEPQRVSSAFLFRTQPCQRRCRNKLRASALVSGTVLERTREHLRPTLHMPRRKHEGNGLEAWIPTDRERRIRGVGSNSRGEGYSSRLRHLLRWTGLAGLPGETLHLPARWPWQHDLIRAPARIRTLPLAE